MMRRAAALHSDDSCGTLASDISQFTNSLSTMYIGKPHVCCCKVFLFLNLPFHTSQRHIPVTHWVQTICLGSLIEPLYQGGNPQKKCNFVPNAPR